MSSQRTYGGKVSKSRDRNFLLHFLEKEANTALSSPISIFESNVKTFLAIFSKQK